VDFSSSSPEVQAKIEVNFRSMIRQGIHSTDRYPAMAQLHNDQGIIDENFLDYVPEKLIEQPDNSLNSLSNFVAATETRM